MRVRSIPVSVGVSPPFPGAASDGATMPSPQPPTAGAALHEYVEALRAWLVDAPLDAHRANGPGAIEDVFERDRELLALLWDRGWTRWGWPEEVGGLGGNALWRAALYDELARVRVAIPEAMAMIDVMGPAMVRFAPELAARFLPAYLRGDEGWCQGFSEPDAGSDLAALRLTAHADGDGFRVRGQKCWSSHGTGASRCFLLARTGEQSSRHRGLSVLFVDLDQPGITVQPVRASTGRNEFADIFFDDVFVPSSRLVGGLGDGWGIAMSLLQWERGMYGWQRQALLHRDLEQLVALAPPSSLPDGRIGEAYLALAALRARCRRTVERLATDQEPGATISVDKLLLSAAELTFHDVLIEALEPRLELDDDPLAGRLREQFLYSRASSIYGGTVEIQRNILADLVLELPREPVRG